MSYKNLNGLSKLEQHYFDLAEVYLTQYNDHLLSSKKIMVVQGIIVTMYSDLMEFLIKNKPTDKSNVQKQRLEKLLEITTEFSKVSSNNIQMQLDLKCRTDDYNKLKIENKELKDELEAIRKAWNTEK